MVTTFHDLIEEPLTVLSAIEWTINQHHVKTDEDSGIVHDSSEWTPDVRPALDPRSRRPDHHREAGDMQIFDSSPAMALRKDQRV